MRWLCLLTFQGHGILDDILTPVGLGPVALHQAQILGDLPPGIRLIAADHSFLPCSLLGNQSGNRLLEHFIRVFIQLPQSLAVNFDMPPGAAGVAAHFVRVGVVLILQVEAEPVHALEELVIIVVLRYRFVAAGAELYRSVHVDSGLRLGNLTNQPGHRFISEEQLGRKSAGAGRIMLIKVGKSQGGRETELRGRSPAPGDFQSGVTYFTLGTYFVGYSG